MRQSWLRIMSIEFPALLLGGATVSWLREVLEFRSVEWGSGGSGYRVVADIVVRLGMYVAWRSVIGGLVRCFGTPRRLTDSGDLYASVVAEMHLDREIASHESHRQGVHGRKV